MSEFPPVETLATLPVAIAVVALAVNVLRRSFQFNPTWLALAVSLVYSAAVFVWPIPPAAQSIQDWFVRAVVAIGAAFIITGTASDVSGRMASRSDDVRSASANTKLWRRWY